MGSGRQLGWLVEVEVTGIQILLVLVSLFGARRKQLLVAVASGKLLPTGDLTLQLRDAGLDPGRTGHYRIHSACFRTLRPSFLLNHVHSSAQLMLRQVLSHLESVEVVGHLVAAALRARDRCKLGPLVARVL